MRAKIGDVVIDRTYNKKGNLAIVVGEGISQPILIYHKGGITMDKLRDYFATWDGLEVIGHIDFEKVWEEAVLTADRKTEPTQNQHIQSVESVGEDRKTEPKTKEYCKGCKYNEYPYDSGTCFVRVCINGNKYEPKDEPQTEREGE